MKHIIIGGDGFVGSALAADLAARGQQVLVADIVQSDHAHYAQVPFRHLDVTDRDAVLALPIAADDMVYNLSAKMLSPIMPRAKRRGFFWPVNFAGTQHILEAMGRQGAMRLVHFTTDMIYGHARSVPITEDHPAEPLGEYGRSKLASEDLCRRSRGRGMRISIFRPRLIIGPGRLGILLKLFRLIDAHLPVPMIGPGRNPYQFVSVFDCAAAARLAWEAGCPNAEYNLGSDDPPSVRALLTRLIREAGSRSVVVPTPAPLVKRALDLLDLVNLPLMDPEQYRIADEHCVVDTTRAKRELGWQAAHRDDDMLIAAYREYRAGRAGAKSGQVEAQSKPSPCPPHPARPYRGLDGPPRLRGRQASPREGGAFPDSGGPPSPTRGEEQLAGHMFPSPLAGEGGAQRFSAGRVRGKDTPGERRGG